MKNLRLQLRDKVCNYDKAFFMAVCTLLVLEQLLSSLLPQYLVLTTDEQTGHQWMGRTDRPPMIGENRQLVTNELAEFEK